jgi:hypothetical protein
MKPWDINVTRDDPMVTRDDVLKLTKILKIRENEFLLCYIDFVFVLGEETYKVDET